MQLACGIAARKTPVDAEAHWKNTPFHEYKKSGTGAFQRGDYKDAALQFAAGANAARAAGDRIATARFLANQGAALFTLTDNRAALPVLLAARSAAQSAGDPATQQIVEGNLASLYSMSGAMEDAYVAATRGAAIQPPNQAPEIRALALMSFARSISRFRGVPEASEQFRSALALAVERGTASLEADVLEIWGFEWMRAGNLAAAEELLARAWVARKRINDRRLPLTEGKLASLFRQQGNIGAARFWHGRVQATIDAGVRLPFIDWAHVFEKAMLEEASGDDDGALVEFRRALEMARVWRERIAPADRLRLSSESSVNELFDGYLRVAARVWKRSPKPALAAEMFAALQQHRAWSAQKAGAAQAGEALHSMARRLEGEWLAGNREAQFKLAALRTEIAEQESSVDRRSRTANTQWKQPEAGSAVVAFWLHEEGSLVWLWTEGGIETARIGPRSELLRRAEAFRNDIASGRDAGSEGLLAELFGAALPSALRKKRWEIVADESLALVPFAAMRHKPGRYLVEDIEVHFIPNALSIDAATGGADQFLAVADPVFNAADERRLAVKGRGVQASHWALSLSRLPGTLTEAVRAAGMWERAGFRAAILAGAESSEESVLANITARKPAVLHLATHTAAPAGDEQNPRLVLSLRADGSPGLLTAEDIAALDCPARVVVLSACQSSGASTTRGAGVLGLTRAWLTAGASQVVSTLWPVGDDTAYFYSEFHDALAKGGTLDAARALRETQLRCIRQAGHRGKPTYWAAHALLARR
jgi:CHAT domain-containing protein